MNKPLISVIVPVYNTEQYLPRCIESIISQTYQNLEIILVNDGSVDNSLKICKEYAQKDSRIVVVDKENGGQSTARNMALKIAKGKYIGFADSDDYIAPEMYETLYECLTKTGSEISVCARTNVFENGQMTTAFTLKKECVMTAKEAVRRFLVYDALDSATWDKLFKAELFEGIEFPSGYICEDVVPLFVLLSRAKKIVHCGKPLYYYLQRTGSTSRSMFSEKAKGLDIYHEQVSALAKQMYPEFKREADYFYLSRLPALYSIILRTGYNGEYKAQIIKIMKQNSGKVIFNKHFSMREKIKYLLITVGLFQAIQQLRGKNG